MGYTKSPCKTPEYKNGFQNRMVSIRKNKKTSSNKLFERWLLQLKEANSKYTRVELTCHNVIKDSNFVMLRQESIQRYCENKIIIHYKSIPWTIEHLNQFYVRSTGDHFQNKEMEHKI